jgi:hypothetical protein
MNVEKYFAYLEDLASRHVEIHHRPDGPHFFRVAINELQNAIGRKAQWPILAALNPIMATETQGASNMRLSIRGSVLILDRLEGKMDFAQRLEVEQKCFAIARDVILKMVNDRKSYDLDGNTFALSGLDFNSFEMELVPDTYNGFAGCLLQFKWNYPLGQFDASRFDGVETYTL